MFLRRKKVAVTPPGQRRTAAGGEPLVQEHTVDDVRYLTVLLQQAVIALATGRASALTFLAVPAGTFLLGLQEGTDAGRILHIEMYKDGNAGCPHCIILSMSLTHAARILKCESPAASINAAYLAALGVGLVPKLTVTLAPGDQLVAELAPMPPDEGIMPFTGGCPTHGHNGR